MRQILVDYARSHRAQKRGGGALKVELDEAAIVSPEQSKEIVDLHEALERLATLDSRKAQVVELKYFGGLNHDEIAEVLKISPVTVRRDWEFAKAWLYTELHNARRTECERLSRTVTLTVRRSVESNMTPARLQTIEEIFHAALDQEPDQVGAFLDTACEGDELLRRKVEALLASHQRAGSFIETPAVGIATRIIENGQADLLVGQTIGHYKISKRIGSGGMGEVYLATDMTAGRKAALKLLPMRFTGDAERLKRFQQEAHAVVGLNHPNILTVYEIGEDHSTHYIASELIEGETLRQRLTRGRMELSEAVDVAIQVASALAAAHEAGIVHRDIKPENIMLRPDGYVKVLDFGIAKLAEQEVPATMPEDEALLLVETNLGSILGTVRYMSPEQARGAPVDKAHRYLESRRGPLRNGNGACAIHRRDTKRGDDFDS